VKVGLPAKTFGGGDRARVTNRQTREWEDPVPKNKSLATLAWIMCAYSDTARVTQRHCVLQSFDTPLTQPVYTDTVI